jgi:hypothetical protein
MSVTDTNKLPAAPAVFRQQPGGESMRAMEAGEAGGKMLVVVE